jgi:hypothetical protein
MFARKFIKAIDSTKLNTIKKRLYNQADKFMGQFFLMGFKSPSFLREGFRMGKFR